MWDCRSDICVWLCGTVVVLLRGDGCVAVVAVVQVSEKMEVLDREGNPVEGVYCIGDANGKYMLAHAASAQVLPRSVPLRCPALPPRATPLCPLVLPRSAPLYGVPRRTACGLLLCQVCVACPTCQ